MKRAIRRHHDDRVKQAHREFAREVLGWNLSDPKIWKRDWLQHPCDCGKKDCRVCHYEKVYAFETCRTRRAVSPESETMVSRTRVRARTLEDLTR